MNLLTGLGAGLSAVSIPLAFRGLMREAWILMGVALLIDWVDGSLVRYFNLESVLPAISGDELDAFA
ncbi:MAG: phosphatidylcholine/phosphatidylserine synthase, partial [bacterium]